MGKTVFRYFFDFICGQQAWLNSMAAKGYRLKRCGRLAYVFDECSPDEYEYAVEFVGTQSYSKAKQYREFLEGMGFRTFTKNINLNFSVGKVKWRPYAKGMGQIAASPGGYNKELIILEKKKDGTAFELYTDINDKLGVFMEIRRTFLWAVLAIAALITMTFIPNAMQVSGAAAWVIRCAAAASGALFLIPAIKYSALVSELKRQGKLYD